MGSFKRGIVLGGLLGAGLAWLNLTTKGKQTRQKLLSGAEDVYTQVRDKVMTSELKDTVSKNAYVKMVQEYVDSLAQKNDWADNTKNMIVKIVSSQWKNLQSEIKKHRG